MPCLAANSDSSSRRATYRMLYVLVAKHSFPSRLHQEPTVHKSVPKPTSPASFKTTRGSPSYSQAFQPVPRGSGTGDERGRERAAGENR